MGLDMYLSRKVDIEGFGDVKKMTIEIKDNSGKTTRVIGGLESGAIIQEVAYWRKANMVHAYLTNPHDDRIYCVEGDVRSEFGVEVLLSLRDLCEKVVKIARVEGGEITNKEDIAELLPTQSGFFFGSTAYDKDYVECVQETIELLDKVLSGHEQLLEDGVYDWQIAYQYIASY